MKKQIPLIFIALISLSSCGNKPAEEKWQILFNGKDLTGWDTYLGPTFDTVRNKFDTLMIPGLNNDPKKVFSVVDEIGEAAIRISGDGFGGISTVQEFEDYHLRIDFKWGKSKFHPRKDKKRDSGILYHATGPQGAGHGNWMRSQEFQVQEGDCGDYWSVDGSIIDILASGNKKEEYKYDPTGEKLAFSYTSDYGRRCIKNPDTEKTSGEWNTVDIYCFGGNSIHVMNGTVVMKLFNSRQPFEGKEIPLTKGKIQIQTEGAEVYYKNIQVAPITEMPADMQ